MFIERKEGMIRAQSGEYWRFTYAGISLELSIIQKYCNKTAQSPLLDQVPKTTTDIMSQSREGSNGTNKTLETTFK